MSKNEMVINVNNMKKSLNDINELTREVSEGLFLPKRFRKAPFTPQIRDKYVKYLRKEAEHLEKRIKALESPRAGRPVQVQVKSEQAAG